MKPVYFKQSNKILTRPAGMTDDECGSLQVYNDGERSLSRWSLGWRERLRVLLRGEIWLWVWAGDTQPPVAIEVESPFPDGGSQ